MRYLSLDFYGRDILGSRPKTVRPRRVGPLPHPRVLTTPRSPTPCPTPPPSCGTRTARGDRGDQIDRGQRSGLPLRAASHPVVARRGISPRDVREALSRPAYANGLPLSPHLLLVTLTTGSQRLAKPPTSPIAHPFDGLLGCPHALGQVQTREHLPFQSVTHAHDFPLTWHQGRHRLLYSLPQRRQRLFIPSHPGGKDTHPLMDVFRIVFIERILKTVESVSLLVHGKHLNQLLLPHADRSGHLRQSRVLSSHGHHPLVCLSHLVEHVSHGFGNDDHAIAFQKRLPQRLTDADAGIPKKTISAATGGIVINSIEQAQVALLNKIQQFQTLETGSKSASQVNHQELQGDDNLVACLFGLGEPLLICTPLAVLLSASQNNLHQRGNLLFGYKRRPANPAGILVVRHQRHVLLNLVLLLLF